MGGNIFVGVRHDGKMIFVKSKKTIGLVTGKINVGRIITTKKLKEIQNYGNVSE